MGLLVRGMDVVPGAKLTFFCSVDVRGRRGGFLT